MGYLSDSEIVISSLRRLQDREERERERVATDIDETRRLLYMALVAHRTPKHNLVGTLANALLHHSDVIGKRDDILDMLVDLVESGDASGAEWAKEIIETLTARLNRAN